MNFQAESIIPETQIWSETGVYLSAKFKQDGAAVELLGWFLFVGKSVEIMK